MAYYPKSQIQTNLYTDGNDYRLSTNKEQYVGYYYLLSNGKKYTGKSQNDKPNILLEDLSVPISNNIKSSNLPPSLETNHQLSYSTPNISQNIYLPQYNQPLPTPDDYKRGIFTRYFCKKTNENKYLEVDQITYNKLTSRDSSILWSLYTPFSIQWKISPDESANSLYNQSSTFKTLNSGDYRGFSSYIKNYSQYTPTTEGPNQQSNSNSSTGGGGNFSRGGY